MRGLMAYPTGTVAGVRGGPRAARPAFGWPRRPKSIWWAERLGDAIDAAVGA